MLLCPKCGGDTRVLRSFDDERTVVRLRECKRCSYSFMTTEMINQHIVSFMEVLSRIHQQEEQD